MRLHALLTALLVTATVAGCGGTEHPRLPAETPSASVSRLLRRGTPHVVGRARVAVPRGWVRAPRAQAATFAGVIAQQRSGASSAWVPRDAPTEDDGRRLPVLVVSGADLSSGGTDPDLAAYANGFLKGIGKGASRRGGAGVDTELGEPIRIDGEDAAVGEVHFDLPDGSRFFVRATIVRHGRFIYQTFAAGKDADGPRIRSVVADVDATMRWR